jgi:hypothetical protein
MSNVTLIITGSFGCFWFEWCVGQWVWGQEDQALGHEHWCCVEDS